MNCDLLEKYFSERGKTSIAKVQLFFSTGYKETREAFFTLEKEGLIRLEDGIDYVYCGRRPDKEDIIRVRNIHSNLGGIINERDEFLSTVRRELKNKPEIYKEVLRFCVRQGVVSRSLLRLNFKIGYTSASEIYDWLKRTKIIIEKSDYSAKVLITEDDLAQILQT